MMGTLENPGRRGRGGKEKEWTDCVADDPRLFGIGDGEGWKTVALDSCKWREVVMKGWHTFMATWRTGEERAAGIRRSKRKAEEADKTPIAPGVTARQLRTPPPPLPGRALFWPIQAWKSSGLVLVFDDDNSDDHMVGTILQNLQLISPIHVRYEKKPPENTTCSTWRREGYARQQYSNFYADLYTDADYVALIDGDTSFTAPVLISDLFEDGKPKVRGFDQVSRWAGALPKKAIGGVEDIGAFMTPYSFPMVFKTSHFAQMREDITRNLGAASFEDAFHMICSVKESPYSQFDIMYNYLWYNKRDEYKWHIAWVESGAFTSSIKTEKTIPSFDEAAVSANVPTVLIMRHWGEPTLKNKRIYNALCIGSCLQAGDCKARDREEMYEDAAALCTSLWSVEDYPWNATMDDHIDRVCLESSVFSWHYEDDADKIVVGS